jgi:uncharacterized protein (TIGR02246 family)
MRDFTQPTPSFRVLLLLICLSTFGCMTGHETLDATNASSSQALLAQQQVLSALGRYEDAIRRMAYREIADLYEQDGEIVHNRGVPIKGRETIRQFLVSFSNYKVLENITQAETTETSGNLAHQIGHYSQLVLTPVNETVRVNGKFEAHWRRMRDGDWRLLRMHTTSPS